jgi:hypothetical protein
MTVQKNILSSELRVLDGDHPCRTGMTKQSVRNFSHAIATDPRTRPWDDKRELARQKIVRYLSLLDYRKICAEQSHHSEPYLI